MRSTRATAAVARLNSRSNGRDYRVVITGAALFRLHERIGSDDRQISEALSLDDFVRLVDAMGPQTVVRITKNEAAFARQLVKKENPP